VLKKILACPPPCDCTSADTTMCWRYPVNNLGENNQYMDMT
jgi:hypothetical protein